MDHLVSVSLKKKKKVCVIMSRELKLIQSESLGPEIHILGCSLGDSDAESRLIKSSMFQFRACLRT